MALPVGEGSWAPGLDARSLEGIVSTSHQPDGRSFVTATTRLREGDQIRSGLLRGEAASLAPSVSFAE